MVVYIIKLGVLMKVLFFRIINRLTLIILGLLFCVFLAFYIGLFVHILNIFSSYIDELYKSLLPGIRDVTFSQWSILLVITVAISIFSLFAYFSLIVLKNIFSKIYLKFFKSFFSEQGFIESVNNHTDKALNFFVNQWSK